MQSVKVIFGILSKILRLPLKIVEIDIIVLIDFLKRAVYIVIAVSSGVNVED